jgi:hypothetical protein
MVLVVATTHGWVNHDIKVEDLKSETTAMTNHRFESVSIVLGPAG